MSRRIGLISEHASPLCSLGGADSGGQNVYVGQLARHLAGLGYQVDVFTRRDSQRLPEVAEWVEGVRIIHVPCGPAEVLRKEELLSYMGEFTAYVLAFCKQQRYDLLL
ncbi:glycosyltransferase [Leptolyngbya sp. FACHB-261]|uniref:glycosyltransferase n=1 Tax=Leptolyngbya sp. FACHB-261 TaxID=2692806 RepID=UPI001689F822|nr:glycosyltransferase [Leptolyngbya sp. FACHB-261]MBD2101976.1 glycosyltransferase [Leptolyngbya sp. FACHB-261]